jgi:uncharacterized protein YbjT (DUF2867 family)
METTLVVGATGQLGLASIHELLARGRKVRALIRQPESAALFHALGVETVSADLTDPASLRAALIGVSCVIATANAAIPSRPTDSFVAVERDGYRNLIEAAVEAKVSRFVYTSVRFPSAIRLEPFFRYKLETEQRIRDSGLDHVIFQADIFMDVSFAMVGSSMPLVDAQNPTILRPFPFARNYFQSIAHSIEKKHVARIPGDGTSRHGFICVHDVAKCLAASATGGPSGTFILAGPESLTFLEVVGLYEKLLGLKLKVSKSPAFVFRFLSFALAPFNPAGANLMWLNYLACRESTCADPGTAAAFGISLTSAESFLRQKLLARTANA